LKRRLLVTFAILLCVVLPSFADDGNIYKTKCAMCHGADGKGMTPVGKSMKLKDLASDDVQKLSDQQILTIISNGKDKMPAFKGKLTPAEIDGQVKVIRTFKK
jgi:mono/diheme cytochrome c family protein